MRAMASLVALLALLAPVALRGGVEGDVTVHPGDLFVVTPPAGSGSPLWAELDGHRFPAVKDGEDGGSFFLLGLDLEAEPGIYPLTIFFAEEVTPQRMTVEVRQKDFPVEELSLPERMVTPPAEVLERIAEERKAAAAVYASSAPSPMWSPPFTRPVKNGTPSGNFGRRRILNGKQKSPHSGEDYKAPRGSEVKAVGRGRIRMARDLYYSGKTVLIDHGGGLVSQYFHLDRLQVAEDQRVEKGDPIGSVGSTGRVTGPHLHFGIRLFGMRSDPSLLWKIFSP